MKTAANSYAGTIHARLFLISNTLRSLPSAMFWVPLVISNPSIWMLRAYRGHYYSITISNFLIQKFIKHVHAYVLSLIKCRPFTCREKWNVHLDGNSIPLSIRSTTLVARNDVVGVCLLVAIANDYGVTYLYSAKLLELNSSRKFVNFFHFWSNDMKYLQQSCIRWRMYQRYSSKVQRNKTAGY